MLRIVIANPMQFTMVNAVPLYWMGAFFATNVENNGESAITAIPQTRRKISKMRVLLRLKTNGKTRQLKPDKASAKEATFLVPNLSDKKPLPTQAKLPTAIMINDHKEILMSFPCPTLKEDIRTGTKAQKAYNSHI